jgi:hypothetical protein
MVREARRAALELASPFRVTKRPAAHAPDVDVPVLPAGAAQQGAARSRVRWRNGEPGRGRAAMKSSIAATQRGGRSVLVGFFLFGLLNNLSYVVMLSAAGVRARANSLSSSLSEAWALRASALSCVCSISSRIAAT